MEVVLGCRRLVQTPLPKDAVVKACREYNEKALWAVLVQDIGFVGIICNQGRAQNVASDVATVPYVDHRLREYFYIVDHERQECISSTPKSTDVANFAESLCMAIQQELDVYVTEHYSRSEGIAGGVVHAIEGSDPQTMDMHIIISSRRSRPRGYWAGMWGSTWNFNFTPGKYNVVSLNGKMSFTSYYSEDGNVHFQRSDQHNCEVNPGRRDVSFAKELIKAIDLAETAFHEATEVACVTVASRSLKAMRRVLSVSKERFDWRPTRHALVHEIRQLSEHRGIGHVCTFHS